MALSIKHPQADQLARELAAETGESITDAVLVALRERLERLERQRGRRRTRGLREEVARIQARVAALPILDARPADEILGLDESGLPR